MDRRLAAILAADVVGYSRLIGTDEDRTVRVLSQLQNIAASAVAENGGRIFSVTGDGMVAEFASVLAAVIGALTIQRQNASQNKGVPTAERLELRIGITQGEV